METSPPPIKVLIVDDVRMFVDSLSTLLNTMEGIEVCGKALSGSEALECCRQALPDAVLLDISMPEQDGMATLLQLKAYWPNLPVIMLTIDDDYASIQECLQKGATGYVLKDNDVEILRHAIMEVAAGRRYFDPQVLNLIVGGVTTSNTAKSGPPPLTRREVEVLKLLAGGKTSERIAQELFLSHHTIETHRKNILSKLGAKNMTEAVKMAIDKKWL